MQSHHVSYDTVLSTGRLPALVTGVCLALSGSVLPASPADTLPQPPAVQGDDPLSALKVPAAAVEAAHPQESGSSLPEVQMPPEQLPISPEFSADPPLARVSPPVSVLADTVVHSPAVTDQVAEKIPAATGKGEPTTFWQYAQSGALWVSLIGIPFLWLTWRKRADEALDRWKVNEDIKNGRLESDIRLNVHRFEEKSGVWSMQIFNTGRVTVKELFGDQNIYADVLGKAASLSDASQPFPIFNFGEALATFNQMARAFVRRTSLPTEELMSYNCRVRTRDLISAEFNPERRALDPDRALEQRRIFGILVREKSPQASTLVLCVIPESSFARFGDSAWVADLKANSDAHDIVRIDQIQQAYEKERDFLNGNSSKSVFPWANVLFPVSAAREAGFADDRHHRHRQRDATVEAALPEDQQVLLANTSESGDFFQPPPHYTSDGETEHASGDRPL